MASWVHNPRYPEVPASRINPSLAGDSDANRLTAFMQCCEFRLCIPSVPNMRGERNKIHAAGRMEHHRYCAAGLRCDIRAREGLILPQNLLVRNDSFSQSG